MFMHEHLQNWGLTRKLKSKTPIYSVIWGKERGMLYRGIGTSGSWSVETSKFSCCKLKLSFDTKKTKKGFGFLFDSI